MKNKSSHGISCFGAKEAAANKRKKAALGMMIDEQGTRGSRKKKQYLKQKNNPMMEIPKFERVCSMNPDKDDRATVSLTKKRGMLLLNVRTVRDMMMMGVKCLWLCTSTDGISR